MWVYGESTTSSWPNLSPNAQTTFFWFVQFSHLKHIQNKQKRHWVSVVTTQNQKSFYFWPSKTIYGNDHFDFFCYFQCVPKAFPNNNTRLSHMFCPKFSYFHLYRWAKGNHSIFQYKFLFWKDSNGSILLWWANQNGSLQKRKMKLGGHHTSS